MGLFSASDSGQEQEAYAYDAFGSQPNASFGSLTFVGGQYQQYGAGAGYQTDPDTGLIRCGNRYYNPSIGRFITNDPAQSGTNWYSYGDNNPTGNLDPSGLSSQPGTSNKPGSGSGDGGDDDGGPWSNGYGVNSNTGAYGFEDGVIYNGDGTYTLPDGTVVAGISNGQGGYDCPGYPADSTYTPIIVVSPPNNAPPGDGWPDSSGQPGYGSGLVPTGTGGGYTYGPTVGIPIVIGGLGVSGVGTQILQTAVKNAADKAAEKAGTVVVRQGISIFSKTVINVAAPAAETAATEAGTEAAVAAVGIGGFGWTGVGLIVTGIAIVGIGIYYANH